MIIFWSLMLALWLALLAGTFVKRKVSRAALRWLAAGMLLMAVNMIVREVATTGHRWPPGQLLVVDAIGLGSAVITIGCVGVSTFILIRSGQWVRRQPASGVGDGRR